jgi:hypothetical protein
VEQAALANPREKTPEQAGWPYRDPESQAFIESWFGQFKKRLAWRSEWESLDKARKEISNSIDGYQQRPHSRLPYRWVRR